MAYTLSVSTQKGGAGKTTVAINTAGALAQRGYYVLLVDLDPQGHATEGTGQVDGYDSEDTTLRDVLLDSSGGSGIAETIVHTGEFDLAPANADMAAPPQLEAMLSNSNAGEKRLTLALESVQDYDFIIIDCPPSLGALTDNALLASEKILVPAKASGTSMRALELLLDKKQSLEYLHDVQIDPVGVVANEVRQSGVSDQMLEWLDETFSSAVPVWELRKRVALERAWLNGSSIYEHEEECEHAEEVFDEIAEYLEGQL